MAYYVFQFHDRNLQLQGRDVHAKDIVQALDKVLKWRPAHYECFVRVMRMRRPEHGGNVYFTNFKASKYYFDTETVTETLKQEEEKACGVH